MQTNRFTLVRCVLLSVIFTTACGQKVKFGGNSSGGDSPKVPPILGELPFDYVQNEVFPYKVTNDQFQQEMFDENTVTVVFKAYDKDGASIKDLKKDDFDLEEGPSGLNKFTFSSRSTNTGQTVDIVFAIDTTGSMSNEINSVKEKVSKFVDDLFKKNVKANVCLLTFKDEIKKKCDKFVMDDPGTAENENLKSFLSELSKVSASGGGKLPENSMGGVLSAAKDTPWNMGAQRMVVMFTDDKFWIKPRDNGESEAKTAPTYPEVLDAISNYQTQVFVVGTKEPGYNSDFQNYPSITEHGKGYWFDIEKLRKGKITIDDIFNYINDQITTNYTIQYGALDNGLDPRKPLNNRQIKIKAKGGKGVDRVDIQNVQSNMPNGHPELKKVFTLNKSAPIDEKTLSVYVNGRRLPNGYSLLDGDLHFDEAPDSGAKINVEYELGGIFENVEQHPIVLDGAGELVT
ncbi:MAG: VWA domain-containing protein, partial [Bdellovibrionales bacterium]|nr:VWA domain-containing protein [Bdellovibrionales bacterium]